MTFPTPRTIFAVPIIILATILMGSLAILFSFFDRKGNSIEWCSIVWANMLAFAAGMKTKSTGVENVDPTQTYVVVSNHESHMDTVALFLTSPNQLRMLAKAGLFKIPVFGQAIRRAGHIPVHRKGKSKIDFQKLLQEVDKLKTNGRSVVVFAEGKRSLDGVIQEFKTGAFHIAKEFDLPILPVTICGSRDILPAKTLQFSKGEVNVVFHKPFHVEAQSAKELAEKTRQIVISAK